MTTTNDLKSIQEILQECAELRGTPQLMDRIYEQFNLFVMDVLFANDLDDANLDKDIQSRYYLLLLQHYTYTNIPRGLAEIFRLHCEELYGNDAQIQHYKDQIKQMQHDITIYEKRIQGLEKSP